jgi:hypothetical protein
MGFLSRNGKDTRRLSKDTFCERSVTRIFGGRQVTSTGCRRSRGQAGDRQLAGVVGPPPHLLAFAITFGDRFPAAETY